MKTANIYDVVGIGIGPFNLGLAALAGSIPDLKCAFFDRQREFNWHQGLLLPGTRLQVPFFADLVTIADPTSPFTYLNFLKSKGRIFRFAISENNFVTRFEYNQYCQWVACQLPNLHFGMDCEAINYNEERKIYEIYMREKDGRTYVFHGKNIVVGVGSVPELPESIEDLGQPFIFHSSDYLYRKDALLQKKIISLIGSGQSAAEIFYDLLEHTGQFESLTWFCRSEYIFPMDSSKFAFEMTSMDYIEYFYGLPDKIKQKIQAGQNRLYKGVNKELIDAIYERLYLNELYDSQNKIKIYVNSEFEQFSIETNGNINLQFFHVSREQYFEHKTEAAIFATGYKYSVPEFLEPIKRKINRNPDGNYLVNRNYSIDNHNTIFVQNADLHSHGFNSADLGMGPYRNGIILNTVAGHEHFTMEKNTGFQRFGLP